MREGSVFFSEEKNQKTFALCARQDPGHGPPQGAGGKIKVFWFFSSEKNILESFGVFI
jgi:hypothetical protein